MLTLNLNLPGTKQKDWVYLRTQDGLIAVSAKSVNGQLKLLIEAPRSVEIDRKSYIQKQQKEISKNSK